MTTEYDDDLILLFIWEVLQDRILLCSTSSEAVTQSSSRCVLVKNRAEWRVRYYSIFLSAESACTHHLHKLYYNVST